MIKYILRIWRESTPLDKWALVANFLVAVLILFILLFTLGCAQIAGEVMTQAAQDYARSTYWSEEWCERRGLTDRVQCCKDNWNTIHNECGDHDGQCIINKIGELCYE